MNSTGGRRDSASPNQSRLQKIGDWYVRFAIAERIGQLFKLCARKRKVQEERRLDSIEDSFIPRLLIIHNSPLLTIFSGTMAPLKTTEVFDAHFDLAAPHGIDDGFMIFEVRRSSHK